MKKETRIIVLGAGHIGRAMAKDLKKSGHRVTVADLDKEVLAELRDHHQLETVETDFTDQNRIQKLVQDYDLVVGAAPGHLGYKKKSPETRSQQPEVRNNRMTILSPLHEIPAALSLLGS